MVDNSYQPKVYRDQGGNKLTIKSGGVVDFESGSALKVAGVDVTSELAKLTPSVITETGETLALTAALHANKIVVASKVNGQAFTLPAATGSGAKFHIIVGLAITSVGTTIKVVGDDVMKGLALGLDSEGAPANAWGTAADSDTITMDGSTQGGLVGDEVILVDIAADIWAVQVRLQQSGVEATPFSASV